MSAAVPGHEPVETTSKVYAALGDGDITYRYDPVPVDFDAEAERWEKFRREGGDVLNAAGEVIGRVAPGVPDPDEPDKWVATITFDREAHICCSCTADGYGCCAPGHDAWFDEDEDDQ